MHIPDKYHKDKDATLWEYLISYCVKERKYINDLLYHVCHHSLDALQVIPRVCTRNVHLNLLNL